MQGLLDRDRRAGLRVVVERLAERDAEQKQDEREADAETPPDQLPAAAAAAARLTLDGREGRHGL